MLFSPFTIRGLTLKNRIVMSPMVSYSADAEGRATDWHLVHVGARAVGGVGLIIMEATEVEPRGALGIRDLGIWSDDHIAPLARVVDFAHSWGASIGIQINHGGRKAWQNDKGHGPLPMVAPSPLPIDAGWQTPEPLDLNGIQAVVEAFRDGARRARAAGFDVLEIHAAHGYLLHGFLSPLSNERTDGYGGSPKSRMRIHFEVIEAVRSVWPEDRPFFYRVSCTEWVPGGLQPADLVPLAQNAHLLGVDVIDCSSGGGLPATIPVGPGYQVPFAAEIRAKTGIPTAAVGMITEPVQAETILRADQADLIFIGRQLLREPHWPLRAARTLGVDMPWPMPYQRAKEPIARA
ncbi:MAG: NADH:flavin oxidoreductase/NADH oxidase [Chloroflexi bacterium]|nr:NADH:flavin oxidoreductase/NADH oxidase [Chloroflexota bacterium]